MARPIHPFPARMAPELAIGSLVDLPLHSVVLDPMAGSGTVLRHASELGYFSRGFDMDPLAVLMCRTWITPVEEKVVRQVSHEIIESANSRKLSDIYLPWIDSDLETSTFVSYWFARKQINSLRKIAYAIAEYGASHRQPKKLAALDILKVSLSRIIITKESGASLARDTSHSRPHKVMENSDFEVIPAFQRSIQYVQSIVNKYPAPGNSKIELGDARSLKNVRNQSVDAIVTSPPYLNAIDYMRGHRLSLVWLGYSLDSLRKIRSNSIGAERKPEKNGNDHIYDIQRAMCEIGRLESRYRSMTLRYAGDLLLLLSEFERVLREGGRAILVVGNSCIKGEFIRNSNGVIRAAEIAGLQILNHHERVLPERSRYLPMTSGPLAKRMRTETILVFSKR